VKEAKKKKSRGKKIALITVLVIAAILIAVGFAGWNMLEKEHEDILNMTFENLDLSKVQDGTYTGEYAGGLYGWRENSVQVTVENGRITDIELIYSKDGVPADITDELYSKVIESQSLEVDTVSEATITSKAYLKSVEDALAD
jgi:uncharacterized protein with FMN-binding domain